MTLLLPCAALSSSRNSDLWRSVVDYNQRMSGQPRPVSSPTSFKKYHRSFNFSLQLLHYVYDIPVIVSHVWRLLFTVQGVLLLYRLHILLLLLLLLLYLLSPLDLVPESVFGVMGLLDDLVILVAVFSYVSLLYRNYITQ